MTYTCAYCGHENSLGYRCDNCDRTRFKPGDQVRIKHSGAIGTVTYGGRNAIPERVYVHRISSADGSLFTTHHSAQEIEHA